MKKRKMQLNKKVIITLLVIVIIITFSFILSKMIISMEEQACWEQLHSSVNEISAEIISKVNGDRVVLDSISNIINKYDFEEPSEVQKIIDGFRMNDTMLNIALLLPGDRVMLPGEEIMDCSGLLSFEEEAALGRHISNRCVDIRDNEKFIIRNFVPVEKNGEIIAMLYSVMDLQALSEKFDIVTYDGQAAIYVIDGVPGNFLLDTWHDTLGNISDLGKRETKKGYSQEKMMNDVSEGNPGYCVFVSKSIGDYLYFYYEPLGINNWSVGISVPQSVAFARAKKINRTFFIFILLEILVLAGYFIYILMSTQRELLEKQKLAERDMLTGLYNRNSFEIKTNTYVATCNTSLTCVYIDVNGLHELNNTKGHNAGDNMLKAVASALKQHFEDEDIYRIGGDEFVVIVSDDNEGLTDKKMESISECLTKQGYDISVGIYSQHIPIDMEKIIKQAEVLMYDAKKEYYSREGNDRRAVRNKN